MIAPDFCKHLIKPSVVIVQSCREREKERERERKREKERERERKREKEREKWEGSSQTESNTKPEKVSRYHLASNFFDFRQMSFSATLIILEDSVS
jgi:hypothetical protein